MIAAEPNVVADHADAVLLLRPFVACAVATPGLHDIPVGIELNDRRGRHAALPARRLLRGGRLQPRQAARPLHDPDVIAIVDRDAGDLPKRPVVRQRLWPERIDLEFRHLGGHRHRRPGDAEGTATKSAPPD